jgi:hypothetical protein
MCAGGIVLQSVQGPLLPRGPSGDRYENWPVPTAGMGNTRKILSSAVRDWFQITAI